MKKIIWFVDIFEKPSQHSVDSITAFANAFEAKVELVYVALTSASDQSHGYIAPLQAFEEKLDSLSKTLTGTDCVCRVILGEDGGLSSGLRESIKAVLSEDVLCFALSSKGEPKAIDPVLGSFAEALVEISEKPVFLAGTEPSPRTEWAAFATDFSPASEKIFRLYLAAFSKVQPHLLHAIVFPVAFGEGAGPSVPTDYFDHQKKLACLEAQRWQKSFNISSLPVKIIDGGMGSLKGKAIYDAAREAAYVVVGSTSGGLERLIFGSTAKEVLRERGKNVLLFGPKAV